MDIDTYALGRFLSAGRILNKIPVRRAKPRSHAQPRIAIVHDWLVTFGGAERLLVELLKCFPQAQLFATIEFLNPVHRALLGSRDIHTTFVQRLPFARKYYWYYAVLMPLAVEQLNLEEYDIIISSSHAFAKGVLIHPHQVHVSYIHSPPRFIWDMQFAYYEQFGFQRGVKRILAASAFHYLRQWDIRTVNSVDILVANSEFVRRRIMKCYRRTAVTVYPPIDTERFTLCEDKSDYFIACSFMNPFKRLDLVVEAFGGMRDKQLVVVGSGPQLARLKSLATPNVTFAGWLPDDLLIQKLQRAKALIFPAVEDFEMIMAEAQACGTPVIAYGQGGATEIVRPPDFPAPTGLLFREPTPVAIRDAIRLFEDRLSEFVPADCRKNAMRFSLDQFRARILDIVASTWKRFSPTTPMPAIRGGFEKDGPSSSRADEVFF